MTETTNIEDNTPKKRTVNYRPFLDGAKKNLKEPRAQGWLSGNNIALGTAERMGLGFYDPAIHQDLFEILEGIYKVQEIESQSKWRGPAMIIPWEGGRYFTAILIDVKDGAKYIYPKAGTPGIWNESALWTSDGPIIIAADPMDALVLTALDYDAIYSRNTKELLPDAIRSKAPSGTLVMIPEGKEPNDLEDMARIVTGFNAIGVPAICYDLSNYEGDYRGILETMKEGGTDALRGFMESLTEWVKEDQRGAKAEYLQRTTGAYMDTFRRAIGSRTGLESIPTGFESLDNLLGGGLYPGLYIMGAVSSLGKTTLMLQIADHIADDTGKEGHDVLFFSLEQSRDELIAKSLSRLTASLQSTMDYPLSSSDILYKMGKWLGTEQDCSLEDAIQYYRLGTGSRMFIIENDIRPLVKRNASGELETVKDAQDNDVMEDRRIGLDTIKDRIQDHKKITGRAPVVFIDYLQILRQEDPRLSDKQHMDRTVSELRRLSKDYSIPIVVISSLNRSAYGQPITMEAFKESGAIEYSSDVLIGLNPKGLKTGDSSKIKENNQAIFDSLRKEPIKQMEAVILKNRMGSRGEVSLIFNAPYCLYTEGTIPEDAGTDWDP